MGTGTLERIAALNKSRAVDVWQIANNGAAKRRWFVYRETPTGDEYHSSKNGELIRYTFEGALAKAEKLNAERVN